MRAVAVAVAATWWLVVVAGGARGSLLDELADRLAFLKDYFKVHLYVNPHPACAMQAEPCALDNNCCGGLECRMTADDRRRGVGSVCRPKVRRPDDEADEADPDTDEVVWNLGAEDGLAPDDDGDGEGERESTAEEVHRERARQATALAEDTRQVIQEELRRPLSPGEMVSLRRRQEADELRRDGQLELLERWKKDKDEEDRAKAGEVDRLEALAKDRVDRVLDEEDRQKLDMLHAMQAAIRRQ